MSLRADRPNHWNAWLKGTIFGVVTGVAFGLGGFFLASIPAAAGMGTVMFWLVPCAAGFAVALVTRGLNPTRIALALSVLISLALLLLAGKEGPLCAVLAFPLLFGGQMIGAAVGYVFRRSVIQRFRGGAAYRGMALVLAPVLIVLAHHAEQPILSSSRQETVSSSIRVHSDPQRVWMNIQAFDSVEAKKPWLMYIGLPVPTQCKQDRTAVGAKRICYFEHGFIEETITEWSPPHLMRLTIDRTNMLGRHWLGFKSASYELSPDRDGTLLTRTTTITSNLYPAWYWRRFERLGVATEHEYIFDGLIHRISRASH